MRHFVIVCFVVAVWLVGCGKPISQSKEGNIQRQAGDLVYDYSLERNRDGQITGTITLQGAPPNVASLQHAPTAMEPFLKQGTWVVFVVMLSSQHDINAIRSAVRAISQFGGAVQLGLRPLVHLDEMLAWFPEYEGEGRTPVLIVLRQGKLLRWTVDAHSEEEFVKFVNEALQVNR